MPNRVLEAGEAARIDALGLRDLVDLDYWPDRWRRFADAGCRVHVRVDRRGGLSDPAQEAGELVRLVDLYPEVATWRWRNEVQLESPGLRPERWREWLAAFARALPPHVRRLVYAPAVSPGTPDWLEWLQATIDGAGDLGGLDAHAYGSPAEVGAVLEHCRQRWSGRILVTETNFGAGRVYDLNQWAAELPDVLKVCAQYSVEACCVFIWQWQSADQPLPTPVDVRGTPMAGALAAAAAPAADLADAAVQSEDRGAVSETLDGLSLWVWDTRSCPDWLERARRIGARRVLVKAADGLDVWSQWRPACETAKAAGLDVIPWAYSYGMPGEAAVLAHQAESAGVRHVILDPEVELEGLGTEQQAAWCAEVQRLRTQGYTVGCACWARPDAHPGYPWRQLGYSVDYWLPMVAWPVWSPRLPDHWLQHWDTQRLGKAVPWLPTYGASEHDPLPIDVLKRSLEMATARYQGVTVWAAHTLTDEQMAGFRPRDAALTDALNGIAAYHAAAREHLAAAQTALDEQWARVVALKRALGLE